MSLVIYGAHAGDVWAEIDGDILCVTRRDLTRLNRWIVDNGQATLAGVTFDEADVTALTHALNGPQLDDCRFCEQPALVEVDGWILCPGHANGHTQAEDESVAS